MKHGFNPAMANRYLVDFKARAKFDTNLSRSDPLLHPGRDWESVVAVEWREAAQPETNITDFYQEKATFVTIEKNIGTI